MGSLLNGRHSARRFSGGLLGLCTSTRLLLKPLLSRNPRFFLSTNFFVRFLLPAALSSLGGSGLLFRKTTHFCFFFLFRAPPLGGFFFDTPMLGIHTPALGLSSLRVGWVARGAPHGHHESEQTICTNTPRAQVDQPAVQPDQTSRSNSNDQISRQVFIRTCMRTSLWHQKYL